MSDRPKFLACYWLNRAEWATLPQSEQAQAMSVMASAFQVSARAMGIPEHRLEFSGAEIYDRLLFRVQVLPDRVVVAPEWADVFGRAAREGIASAHTFVEAIERKGRGG